MEAENIYRNLPEDLKHEAFEVLAEKPGVKIERIVSKGHTSPETGWYDQDHDEWVMVLQGSAELLFEDKEVIHLEAGDYLNIPAHMKHRVIQTSAEPPTVWLAVHY